MSYPKILKPPDTNNLELGFGDDDYIKIYMPMKRTLFNRFRYWMLCQFFPFRIIKWESKLVIHLKIE